MSLPGPRDPHPTVVSYRRGRRIGLPAETNPAVRELHKQRNREQARVTLEVVLRDRLGSSAPIGTVLWGSQSVVFRVGDDLVAKVSPPNVPLALVSGERRIQQYVYDAGLLVPKPVGRLHTHASRVVTFAEFVPGARDREYVHETDHGSLTAADGALVAALHNLRPPDARPWDPFVMVDEEMSRLKGFTDAGELDRRTFHRLQRYTLAAKTLYDRHVTASVGHLVHGDLWSGNLQHTPNGSALFDFGTAGLGTAAGELIRALYLTTHDDRQFHRQPQAIEFLSGYRAAGGILDEDLIHELLPCFDLRAVLWSVTRGINDPKWAAEAEHRLSGMYVKNGVLRNMPDFAWRRQ